MHHRKLITAITSILLLAIVATASASSVSPSTADAVAKAIHQLDPSAKIKKIAPSPAPGFVMAQVNGQELLVSDDGRFVMQGQLYDMNSLSDVTQSAQDSERERALAQIPESDRIVFTPAHPRHTVIAFVDFDCGYCHALVDHLDEYLAQGIRFEFVAYPRAGVGTESYTKAVDVWCAPDRQQAFLHAFKGEPVASRSCRNPVKQQYEAATALSLPGTPSFLTQEGSLIGGYVEPEKLVARLDAQRTQ